MRVQGTIPSSVVMWRALTVLVALLSSSLASAQDVAANAPQQAPAPGGTPAEVCAKLDALPPPRVTAAYRLKEVRTNKDAADAPTMYTQEKTAKLRDDIALNVDNLDTLLKWQQCTAKLGLVKDIVLYLDNRPLLDVVAAPPLDPKAGVMMFPLRRTEASRDVWTYLLGKPGWNPRKVSVSLGIADQFGVKSSAVIGLNVLPHGWFAFWCGLFLLLIGIVVWLAGWTNILRDGDAPVVPGKTKPWSLTRVQAAWWFFIVLACYLLIGLVTGDYSTSITGTTLVLLGIAAATTAASVVIDKSKDTPANRAEEQAAKQRLVTELAELGPQITTLEGTPNQLAAMQQQTAAETTEAAQAARELQQKTMEQNDKKSQLEKLNRVSESFLTDILSDANGVSFHRFQIAAWTLVLGIIFVVQVIRELAMPQFSETLLGLMGLSAGTFVALKTAEPNAPKPG